jgi:hypothetical protein
MASWNPAAASGFPLFPWTFYLLSPAFLFDLSSFTCFMPSPSTRRRVNRVE